MTFCYDRQKLIFNNLRLGYAPFKCLKYLFTTNVSKLGNISLMFEGSLIPEIFKNLTLSKGLEKFIGPSEMHPWNVSLSKFLASYIKRNIDSLSSQCLKESTFKLYRDFLNWFRTFSRVSLHFKYFMFNSAGHLTEYILSEFFKAYNSSNK